MALKQLLMGKKIEQLRGQLKLLEDARDALTERRTAMQTREAELEAAVNEITDETSEEDRKVVEDATAAFEADAEALTGEETQNEQARADLEKQIEDLQKELNELNERAKPQAPAPEHRKNEERKDDHNMETRTFFGMSMQERDAFFAHQDVKNFLARTRELMGQKRAVSGAELGIPTVMLGLIRDNINKYSKLYKHVRVISVPGKSRMMVNGVIPEAVWTEMCGTLNDINLTFAQVEMDGYKVGGYIAVCNALLEDSDIALATEIITALGQAIGLALDKAILYGTGTKMPLGIVTRLTQTEDPGNAAEGARPWADLHTSNVHSISGKTDAQLFRALIEAAGTAKGEHSAGTKFWAMNEATYAKLVANAMSINAAGAIVSGVDKQMPVIGGAIETLSFIPNDVIVGGYGDLYPLAERAGTNIAQSEHVRFIEDQTVFKGTARYDGKPAVAEGFVAINIGGGTVAGNAVSFASDIANAG